MKHKSIFGAAAIAILLISNTQAAMADEDGWGRPGIIFSFGAPAYYESPPPPPTYYAPPGYWDHHHEEDDDDDN